jgi:hypothetical protein
MKAGSRSRRGRIPSIGTAASKVRGLRRNLKSLVTEMARLEDRLAMLDTYYRSRRAVMANGPARGMRRQGLRGRGPNVRDVAHDILAKSRQPMPITELAERVVKQKGGDAGENFVQNLGAALYRDRRFRRVGRGVYGLRKG